ncbi:hypothetical protein DVK05_04445 [Halorubrum sp. Atlit-8R]|uniref:hypothetical protein n=1 Tax=unclassified Halorubrum TaxID=2642239 RepID=UPI000EF1D000|nr:MULTISPECIES: hypothetical protein [unclassified Halorubrum]RLM70802.1 hypothetical protein DVK08_01315 [Halorubrum sp. Atlit-9R]RLM71670.1 hypothetical protein DVK08_06055 [Halorubrum sp. Atlit-9R]RLM83045.1 hypothetical protein DVK05_04445 [Halorubrum sp. Atlit-8R]
MPTLDISDDHADRIEALRAELAAAHAGPYASVDREDALAYLLDLADAVDDPDRVAAPATGDEDGSERSAAAGDAAPFDRDRARELLASRNRRRSDPDPDDPMDLSDIAAAFEVTGRSEMTKDELIDAVLDAAAALAADPFSRVDIDLDDDADAEDADDAGDGEGDGTEADEDDDGTDADDDGDDASEDAAGGSDDGGAGQLDAMMSLLDTHADKWREADGDARYEVDLPDGSVETARTKDDVRALLFRNY